MLAPFLVLALESVGQDSREFRAQAEDPLHQVVELTIDADGEFIEWTARSNGTVHFWTQSSSIDSRLTVAIVGTETRTTDDDSGGASEAYVNAETAPGRVFRLGVTAAGELGTVELHAVEAPETPATLAAVERCDAALREAETAVAAGDVARGRARLASAWAGLAGTEGVVNSFAAENAAMRIARVAEGWREFETMREVFALVRRQRARSLPPLHRARLDASSNLGTIEALLGDSAAALAVHREVLEVRKRFLPPNHPDVLMSELNVAVGLAELGDHAAAQPLFERVLTEREASLPADHPYLQTALQNTAIGRRKLGDHAGALGLAERLVASRERTLAPGDLLRLEAQIDLAFNVRALGENARSRDLCTDVLEVALTAHHADHPIVRRARASLADSLSRLGEDREALEQFEALLEICERTLPPSHPDHVDARYNLANTLKALRDLDGARAAFERLFADMEQHRPPGHRDLLDARCGLAGVLRERGERERARELLERSLAEFDAVSSVDANSVLSTHVELGLTLLELREFDAARSLLEAALDDAASRFSADHQRVLDIESGLANVRREAGDLHGARELLEHVLEVRSRVLPAHDFQVTAARGNLAAVLMDLGEAAEASSLMEQVVAVLERTHPPGHRDFLIARQVLSNTLRASGRNAEARVVLESVVAQCTDALGADDPLTLMAQLNLAGTLKDLGELAAARGLEESLLASLVRTHAPDDPFVNSARQNLVNTLRRSGDLAATRPYLTAQTRALTTRALGALALSGREAREWIAYDDELVASLLISGADLEPGAVVSLFELIETRRIVVEQASRVGALETDDPEFASLSSQVRVARSDLSAFAAAPTASESDPTTRAAELRRLVDARDRLERTLARRLAERGIHTAALQSSDLAAALPENAVAVGFATSWHFLVDQSGAPLPRSERLHAHVLKGRGSLVRVDLGEVAALEELVKRWRAQIGAPLLRGIESDAMRSDDNALAVELRAHLLDPVLRVLPPETARLFVVPDGVVHLVPLDALPLGDSIVGARYSVVLQPSFARLLLPGAARRSGAGLLAVGAPTYDVPKEVAGATGGTGTEAASGHVDERGGRPDRFSPLLQTRYEVETLARQYAEAFDDEARVLVGDAATAAAVAHEAEGATWVHIATHGWFAVESQGRSAASARAAGGWSWDERVRHYAPMALCGLAFAGANSGAQGADRSAGILTAEELAALDLGACELAVLSACETNVGIRRAGQGIQSLQTALHAAGARTAITSLWKVDDAATRRLFELFYTKLWQEQLGKADALWQAKMALRAEGHPVRDWAGWVLTGDPD